MKYIQILTLICVICCHGFTSTIAYKIGVGRADCTGPPVEIVFVSLFFLLIKLDQLNL